MWQEDYWKLQELYYRIKNMLFAQARQFGLEQRQAQEMVEKTCLCLVRFQRMQDLLQEVLHSMKEEDKMLALLLFRYFLFRQRQRRDFFCDEAQSLESSSIPLDALREDERFFLITTALGLISPEEYSEILNLAPNRIERKCRRILQHFSLEHGGVPSTSFPLGEKRSDSRQSSHCSHGWMSREWKEGCERWILQRVHRLEAMGNVDPIPTEPHFDAFLLETLSTQYQKAVLHTKVWIAWKKEWLFLGGAIGLIALVLFLRPLLWSPVAKKTVASQSHGWVTSSSEMHTHSSENRSTNQSVVFIPRRWVVFLSSWCALYREETHTLEIYDVASHTKKKELVLAELVQQHGEVEQLGSQDYDIVLSFMDGAGAMVTMDSFELEETDYWQAEWFTPEKRAIPASYQKGIEADNVRYQWVDDEKQPIESPE